MHRETHSATLYSEQPPLEPDETPEHHHRLCFDLGLRGVLQVSTNQIVRFDPEEDRFGADLTDCYAGFVIPFNIDFEAYAELGSVDVEFYVGAEQSQRPPYCPEEWLFLESHEFNEGLVGPHWYAHRPSETVYRGVTVPSAEDDPLLPDTDTPPEAANDRVGLQNVESGAMGRVSREQLVRLAESGTLTTVLPISLAART